MKLISIIIIAAAVGCGDRQGRVPTDPRPAPTQEDLIQRNKDALRQEERDIDRFVKRSGLPFLNSPRGVRYVILRDRPGPPRSSGPMGHDPLPRGTPVGGYGIFHCCQWA